MAEKTPAQTIVNVNTDPQLKKLYPDTLQELPPIVGNTTVVITNLNEYTTINVTSPGEPAGNSTEVQFNYNGRIGPADKIGEPVFAQHMPRDLNHDVVGLGTGIIGITRQPLQT